MESIIVLAEGVIALSFTTLAWKFRRSLRPFLWGILLGMVWSLFLHGFCFGVLGIEGPHARDPGGLIGFGIVTAVFAGIPLGTVLGIILELVARSKRGHSGF